MNNILKDVGNANYIMIVADKKSLAGASAFYTHILRLHKKVALVCESQNIENNLSFLPWFDKIKSKKVSSADLHIEFKYSSVELYEYFKKNNIKINPKMATALYAGLLQETDGFLNSSVNGMTFAVAKELVECGAEYKICSSFIMKYTTLASIRLKAIMFKNMLLVNDAKTALFEIKNDDLKSAGASLKDCDEVLKETLKLPHTEEVILLHVDKEYELLRLKYKEI